MLIPEKGGLNFDSLVISCNMNFIAQLVISALAVIITSLLLPGVNIDSALTGILVAAVLAVLNSILKPLLVILTIPITVFTFGLFLLVINASMIMLAGKLVPGFSVDGFWTALFFSIILSLITSLFNRLNKKQED
jgi:putative membrane protein